MLWNIFESLLTLPLLYAIIATIIEFRFGRLKCIIVIGLAAICTIVMDCGLYLLSSGSENLYSYAWLTTCVPSFLCLLYIAKYRDGSFFFAYLTLCVLASITTALSSILAFLLPWKLPMIPLLIHAALLVVIFIASRHMFRDKLFEAARMQGNRWILYCVMPVLSLVIWAIYTGSPAQLFDIENKVYIPYAGYLYPQNIPALIVLLSVFFYTLALVLIIIIRTNQAETERRDKLARTYENKILNERLNSLEEKGESLRILRHDMRHHISTLSGLIGSTAHIQEAQAYLNRLDDNLIHIKQRRFCANAVINAILSSYAEKAQSAGIEFSAEIGIPEILPVDVMDLGTVISNALDNALNACVAQTDDTNRFIQLRFFLRKKQYVLDILNSYDGTVEFGPNGCPLTKQENHGIGSRSISAFVRKFDATADYSAQNGKFRLCIMFTECVKV